MYVRLNIADQRASLFACPGLVRIRSFDRSDFGFAPEEAEHLLIGGETMIKTDKVP